MSQVTPDEGGDVQTGAAAPAAPGAAAPVPGHPHLVSRAAGEPGDRSGKTRNPWGAWLLSLVTFGIYGLWWYYEVNSELRDYDERIVVAPGVSLLAMLVPFVGYFSWARTGARIEAGQRFAGSSHRCSGLLGIVLLWLGVGIVYYQSQLNKIWDAYGNPPPGSVLGVLSDQG